MELKQIKELMAAMGRTGTKRLTWKQGDFELVLEREDRGNGRLGEFPLDYTDEPLRPSISRAEQAFARTAEMPAAQKMPVTPLVSEDTTNQVFITSPMVGTFFLTPSPEDPNFVKLGDKVDKNTVVCIIEAMKVMNEIKSGVAGTITEILVESGQPVEFGTKLFRVI